MSSIAVHLMTWRNGSPHFIPQGKWTLEIHLWDHDQSGEAGFWWSSDAVRGACIHPFNEGDFPDDYPQDFRTYYDLVDKVDWNGVGAGGKFYGADGHPALSSWNFEPRGADIDPDDTYVWGDSPCGDMLIWTMDGRGGWFSLGSRKVHLLGSIAETINWVYSELIEKRCPEWDYSSW